MGLYEKNNSCHPVTFEWCSIQILVNSKIFKLSLNLSFTHLRAQITCYELKRDLSPIMLKEIFRHSFENFEIYKDLYGKPCKRDWVAKVVFLLQMLLTFSGRCNPYFWDIRLKILGYLIFICSFSFC